MASPSNTQATFLGLPRELRDEITAYLTRHHQTRTPPPSPPFAGKRHQGPHSLYYPLDHSTPTRWPNLALVNHQLWHELTQNDAHTTPNHHKPLTAELDLMAKGYCFYPTWTSLPGTLRRGREPVNLTVNLRIFSTEAFRPNDGWPRQPGAGFRSLLALLNNFLLYGPAFQPLVVEGDGAAQRRGEENLDRGYYCVNVLTVSTTFHDLYTPDTWPATSQEIRKRLREVALSGLPDPWVQKVRVVVGFESRGGRAVRVKEEWPIAERVDERRREEWRRAGFCFEPLDQREMTS
ncbi:hypothetical protein B0A50_06946 [Salinomyces thailandicus]|uniref:Uncharacterized protein n=1 Tax=Salinomyces thailandicus TaxID=706561 RepID=A0A4U0TQM4_9PEZI|nr:hypothetical protein B0A50_06946 [Salinomyces thailandica]